MEMDKNVAKVLDLSKENKSWKIEKWFDEVFPGEDNLLSEYYKLPSRELIIVCSAVIDVALAELISLRLKKDNAEIVKFIGANGEGNAPIGSLGAKIQMAYLLNIITKEDVKILKSLKDIRNIFAHRVNVEFKSEKVIKCFQKLADAWKEKVGSVKFKGENKSEQFDELISFKSKDEADCICLLLVIFSVYQAYFYRIRKTIPRIDNFDKRSINEIT